jgi:hypothetical protein
MSMSNKPGLTQKSKSAVATKKVTAKPARNISKSMSATAANKTDVRTVVSAGKRKPAAAVVAGEDRYEMIAIAAYCRAEQRGFNGGNAMQDWLEAEAEIDAAVYR